MRILFLATLFVVLQVAPDADPDLVTGGLMAIGMMLNSGVIWFLVLLFKTKVLPELWRRAPWALPLIAMVSGTLLNLAGAYFSQTLLVPVDFAPLAEAIQTFVQNAPAIGASSGAMAVTGDQVYRQMKKARGKGKK